MGPQGQRGAGSDADLRVLPEPDRVPLLALGEFVVKNADYESWDELARAMARHISYRNGPHRDRRLAEAERRKRVA